MKTETAVRSNRKLAALVLLVVWTSVTAANDDDVLKLSTLLARFLAGASTNDVAAHERFWSDELVYTSSDGTRFGKADILDGMRTSAASQGEPDDASDTVYTAEDVDIRVYADTAVIAFRLIGTSGDVVQQYFNTGTFRRRGDEWQAVAWQATKIPDPPDSE